MDRLIIDPEFRDKIPPLTEDEFSLLEENILSDGAVFSPLIVWDGTILDGHNRYEIIQKHPELTYAVHRLSFANRYEALSWICKNQLGRRNLTPQQKKYLIGQRYEAEKMAHGGERVATVQNEPLPSSHKTRAQIANDTSTSESYVMRAGWYAQGVDAAEEALPGIKQEILTGAIKPTETAVAAVARAGPEERPKLAAALKKPRESGKSASEKPQPIYHKSAPASPRQSTLKQIREISAEMEHPKELVAEDSILRSIEAEIVSFTELCDHFFQEYPRLLSDGRYKQEVIRIMQTMKQYISKIEGGYTE
ncbi:MULTISPECIES: hypothetical protein [Clostridia]|jgi:hypothetical protein|uniref:ParB/Sulfiredoxin domain-containing protein n=3 Tax=Clostridia TaxID=186801 RepID=A0A1I0D5V2_9FIRM|nr:MULTISPECIES: hypothetical protein [Clostridia]MDY3230121.1 hypothetical protein [Clostridiaceae bacterium]MCI6126019.1 hypothetical protein [Enterocloster clostridioformis]MSS36200.1 hypothetical protein [Clostridium porci]MSS89504.1 hypothetical protein [Eisenbergiella porci]SET27604.1 hypothetical protein SAMN05216521_100455 [Enterocloster clostridioformis]